MTTTCPTLSSHGALPPPSGRRRGQARLQRATLRQQLLLPSCSPAAQGGGSRRRGTWREWTAQQVGRGFQLTQTCPLGQACLACWQEASLVTVLGQRALLLGSVGALTAGEVCVRLTAKLSASLLPIKEPLPIHLQAHRVLAH